ncbi:hypothetical protein NMY22_g8101 [Coprinellus aureogranulatus]|nr:hypothetical protein NMY22_g8101 [Coprinellus aureogranulatus]
MRPSEETVPFLLAATMSKFDLFNAPRNALSSLNLPQGLIDMVIAQFIDDGDTESLANVGLGESASNRMCGGRCTLVSAYQRPLVERMGQAWFDGDYERSENTFVDLLSRLPKVTYLSIAGLEPPKSLLWDSLPAHTFATPPFDSSMCYLAALPTSASASDLSATACGDGRQGSGSEAGSNRRRPGLAVALPSNCQGLTAETPL